MRINRNDTVAGLPIKVARDLAKRIDDGSVSIKFIAAFIAEDKKYYKHMAYMKPTASMFAKAHTMVQEMMARDWLEDATKTKAIPIKGKIHEYTHIQVPHPGWYKLTAGGMTLRLASLLKPIPRAKADKIVADLIERARSINARSELLYWVKELRVFGSYNTASPDVADIDVGFELERRDGQYKDWGKANEDRAKASGKQIGFPYYLFYGETEVGLILKNRVAYLSFHRPEELKQLKVKSRQIFERAASITIAG